jgi:hypothetical protein
MVNDETLEVNRFVAAAVDDFAGDIIKEFIGREISLDQQDKFKQLATSWLNLIDTGRYAESWKQLGSKLQAKYSESAWASALRPLLSQAGKIKKRTFRSFNYLDSQGESVVIAFDSSFSNVTIGRETVTMVQEEGHWKITGYSIH